MAWIYLAIAGVLEIVWAIGLKYSEGFSKPLASTITVAAMAVGFWFLALALKEIPIGTGYAVWVGIGAVGTAILGMVLLGEVVNTGRVLSLGLIVVGIIGLKLATPA